MKLKLLFVCVSFLAFMKPLFSQITQFNVLFNFNAGYNERGTKQVMLIPAGPNIFITGDIAKRLSFLGDAAFNYSSQDAYIFTLNLQRAHIKYNYYGNHHILAGRIATPLNFWNDNYHFARVFYPTISRPAIIGGEIIPTSTTGISLQGNDLGFMKFGYDLLVGNGLGSNDILENDKYKSLTAALHIKPLDRMQIRSSVYHDVLSAGPHPHTDIDTTDFDIEQTLYSGSVSYFGNKLEFLAEGTYGINHTDSLGNTFLNAYYVYAGYRIKKFVPYFRYDYQLFDDKELYFNQNDLKRIVGGLRFEINYLAVLKVEYQYQEGRTGKVVHSVNSQIAIGF